MDKATFDEYLKNRYQDQINYYEKASSRNQQKYKNYQWLLIILSTLTTILAAMPSFASINLKYVIVLSSGIVTILSTALKTFQYQELWLSYRKTIEQLKSCGYDGFLIGSYFMKHAQPELACKEFIKSIKENSSEKIIEESCK